MLASKVSLDEVATALKQSDGGLNFVDRRWQLRKYHDTFLGHELVDWLVSYYSDINTRQDAVKFGNKLQTQGLFRHVNTGGVTADEGRKLLECVCSVSLHVAQLNGAQRVRLLRP